MLKRLFKNDLYKNVATLIGGTGIAQALPIAITPILTRIYTPDEFGILAFYMAVVAIIGVASTGRYESAILLPKSDNSALNLAGFSAILALIVSGLTFTVLLLFGDQILGFFGFQSYSAFHYVVPAGVFSYGLFQISTFLLNRSRNYKGIASAKVVRSGNVSVGQLFFGFAGFSTYGLVFGKLFGELSSAIYAWWLSTKNRAFKESRFSRFIMKSEASTYREMPKVNAPHAVSNTVSNQLPNMLLTGFFNPAVAGFYNLSFRICYAPVMLISSSVYQVFSREVSEKQKAGDDVYQFTKSIITKLTLVAIVPFSLLMLFAPPLFEFVFGSEWRIAGDYSRLLAPMLFLVFIVYPITYIPILVGHQRKAFLIDTLYLVLRVLALVTGFYLESATIAIAAYSGVGFVVQLYLLSWLLSLAKSHNFQNENPYKG